MCTKLLNLFPVTGCRNDDECHTTEACINGRCQSPCKCGLNAVCEVLYHKATCKCLSGYSGTPVAGCQGKAVANIATEKVTLEDNFVGQNYTLLFVFPIYSYIYAVVFPALLI